MTPYIWAALILSPIFLLCALTEWIERADKDTEANDKRIRKLRTLTARMRHKQESQDHG